MNVQMSFDKLLYCVFNKMLSLNQEILIICFYFNFTQYQENVLT